MSNEIANTIYQQLGGGCFAYMVGAKKLISAENKLIIHLTRSTFLGTKGNRLTITLNALDLYDIQYTSVTTRNGEWKEKVLGESLGVYADMLRDEFTRLTGLETRIPRIIGINC